MKWSVCEVSVPVVPSFGRPKRLGKHLIIFLIRRVNLSAAARERLEAQHGDCASVDVGR